MRVLFVCTGNTGRSVMAENIMKARIAQDSDPEIHQIDVISAGTNANEGEKAERLVTEIMSERGIILREHNSTQVSRELIESVDLILTMEVRHRDTLIREYGALKEKTHLLADYCGESGEIKDCLGHSKDAYAECGNKLAHLIEKAVARIQAELKENKTRPL